MSGVRIAAIRLACADPAATMAFYRSAFGAVPGAGCGGLRLGDEVLEFTGADASRTMLPPPSNATGFQHCAIVVSDMAAAMAGLAGFSGWSAISSKGPERLPDASGGATAFKFRDPDGHPLEFLAFAPDAVPPHWRARRGGPCLGIDHSAITVADSDRSIAFYAAHGFSVGQRQLNRGPEQGRLDGLGAAATVEVVSLIPKGGAPPHLELLCYRDPPTTSLPATDGSVFATVLRLTESHAARSTLVDPDGHRLALFAPARQARHWPA